jgi:Holliday junction resolvase RusA-like endonuclease
MMYKIVIKGGPVVLKNAKRMVTNKKTGRKFPISSAKVQKYNKHAIPQIQAQKQYATINQPIHLRMKFYGAWKRSGGNIPDLSNLYEAPQDLLTKCGIIADDRIVDSHDGSRRICMCDTCLDRPILKAGPRKGQHKEDCGAVKKCPYQRVEIEIMPYNQENDQ